MFKVVALAAVAALGLSSGAEANAAGAKKVYDGPSQVGDSRRRWLVRRTLTAFSYSRLSPSFITFES